MDRLRVPVALAAAAVSLLVACGRGSGDGPGGAGTSTTALRPSMTSPPATATIPTPTDLTPTARPTRGAALQVTGTLVEGAEHGCLVLVADGASYLLVGQIAGLAGGERVSVEGSLETDLATTCQQGTPLRVTKVLRR